MTRPRIRKVAWLLLACLAVLASACGSSEEVTTSTGVPVASDTSESSGSPEPEPQTTEAAQDETTTTLGVASVPTVSYADSDFDFAVEYPEGWEVTGDISTQSSAGGSASKSIGLFDPEGSQTDVLLLDGVVISAYPLSTVVDESLMPVFKQEIESVLADIEGQLTDSEVLEPLNDIIVNGLPGYVSAFTYEQEGRTMRTRLIFLVDRDVEYELALQADAKAWEAQEPLLNVIVSSFHTGG